MIIAKKKIFDKILNTRINKYFKAEIFSDFCRLNILSSIKIAGSGHLGTSLSAIDIFVWIKLFLDKKKKLSFSDLNRNILFSSKGHDVPALYSVLYSIGVIKLNKLLKLRRLNGLDGHPDIAIKGIETNTGSLGMGISKAKGFAWAKNFRNKKGNVFVLTGDGEFQEGQIFESLQTTYHQKINNIIVIIDHNKIQSSKFVDEIITLRDIKKKIESFGWFVDQCNGHSFIDLSKKLKNIIKVKNKPKLLIANTIKGKGIKTIEHITFMKNNSSYLWHSGAPNDKQYEIMITDLLLSISKKIKKHKLDININDKKYFFHHNKKNFSIDIH